jgi:pilus assembly protein CpaB
VDVVTLLLTPEDSQKLQLASTQGSIQFVLRNGTDTKTAELQPARLDQIVPMPKSPAVVVKGGKRVVVKPKPTYVVDVIQGTKSTVNKFSADERETGKQQ